MPFDQIGAAAPQWFTETELGPNMGLTPEGFLICRNVPLARLGVQRYHASEIPQVAANANGFIDVDRPESEVFNPVSLASFEGKPVTLNHPMTDVGLWNHRALAFLLPTVAHMQRADPPGVTTVSSPGPTIRGCRRRWAATRPGTPLRKEALVLH
jgi:hypothetical protein